MATDFAFQDPGEGIHEAEIREILIAQGDEVREGQEVIVVETDKAAFELSAPRSGQIEEIVVEPGQRVHVGDTLLRFADGEVAESAPSQDEQEAEDEAADQGGREVERDSQQSRADGHGEARRRPVPATPATRRLARELEIDLHDVEPGTDSGRIRPEDVRAHAEGPPEPSEEAEPARARSTGEEGEEGDEQDKTEARSESRFGPVERRPLRSVRRRMAERMRESWSEAARVTHFDRADISELERLRARLQPHVRKAGGKLTLSVLVAKAIAAALEEFPELNASFDAGEEALVVHRYINLGVAVDTERGLMVPVVKNLPGRSLVGLSRELRRLSERAREGDIERDDVIGATFTLTNIGSIGGTGFVPMINHPEVAILGIGRAELAQVVSGTLDDHEVAVRLMLPLALSYDHRVIDGAQAARFVSRLRELLEDPDRYVAAT